MKNSRKKYHVPNIPKSMGSVGGSTNLGHLSQIKPLFKASRGKKKCYSFIVFNTSGVSDVLDTGRIGGQSIGGQLQPGRHEKYLLQGVEIIWTKERTRLVKGFRDLNARFTRTAPEKNKLIVVVPLVLNLDLKLNKQVGFDSVQMISPGRV